MQLFFNMNCASRGKRCRSLRTHCVALSQVISSHHLPIIYPASCSMVRSYQVRYQRCEWRNSRGRSIFRQEVKQALCSFVPALTPTRACSYGSVDASVHFVQGFGVRFPAAAAMRVNPSISSHSHAFKASFQIWSMSTRRVSPSFANMRIPAVKTGRWMISQFARHCSKIFPPSLHSRDLNAACIAAQ